MKLLLTSAGITNGSIKKALLDLLGKPLEQATAVLIPTALYGSPDGQFYAAREIKEIGFDLPWQSFGVLELTATTSVTEELWLPSLETADVIMVGGGNAFYLSYWMHQSGLAAKLPELLRDKVYLGISAGSCFVCKGAHVDPVRLEQEGVYYDDQYDEVGPKEFSRNQTLGLVDFQIRPHLGADYFPRATADNMARWAARPEVTVPLYGIDDQTALKVVDGQVDVITEGTWKLFNEA